MPYIKRVEINGFKTFGAKTTLTFDRGFTIITGPNGSGKTNIIDALLFCLGELSAKRLRAESFSDLIFNGGGQSGVRKNEAKVVIQFDNSDGRIPVETATVTISREIDRSGESVYRINGRKVPRAHLLEVLSIAGISPYGHNIVLQGTLTRMAEISTTERRKIIEDMLGIAQYDAEKAEAEQKLKEADIAIKTALGQISEIQRRIEDLERERNNLLRYNLLKKEISLLESAKISIDIKRLEAEVNGLLHEISELKERSRRISEEKDLLKAKRRELEGDLRKLGFDEIQRKHNRLMELEVDIRSLKSKISDLASKIKSGRSNLDRQRELGERLKRQIELLKSEIEVSEKRAKDLTALLEQLSREIGEKQSLYDSMSSKFSNVRSMLEEKAKRASEIDKRLQQVREEKVRIDSERARSQSEVSVYLQRLEDLKAKRMDMLASRERLMGLLTELEDVANAQRRQIENLKITLEKRIKRKESLEREMKGAERIAELAKEALVRFSAQKSLVKKIKSEELALKSLEEMGSLGVISGIHGRLRNLIKVEDNYVKAVEAAASGWLDSLVVEDMNVAFTCIETLERMRLGRVKIIPVKSISPNNFTNKIANIDGVIGWISSFVTCDECYKPAVEFVLGDTLLALNEDAAIRASKDGFRVVTLDGNLYEAGGGVEGGFYRTPVDLSRFIPSDEALKSLEKAIKALERYLNNKENIISDIEDEISEAQSDIISLSESLAKINGEIERVKKSVSQVETQIRHIESNIEILTKEVESRREQIARFELRLNEICGEEEALKGEYERINGEMELLSFHDTDGRCAALAQEIIDLKRKYGSIESELLAIRMRMERVLKKNLEDLTAQLNEVSAQIANVERELEDALKEESEARRKVEELEKIRDNLSMELSAAREKIDAFTSQIDSLDVKISNLDQEYYDCIKSLNDREMRMQSINLQINRFRERLRELGCEEPNEPPVDLSIEDIEAWMEAAKDEFKRIGAINQLAESQYLEQASRYKELSIRLNELEMERSAILKFISEIEQKKINIFMDAFNKINERINRYFCRLTGGGSALLKLENPENPFGGGVDMIVQFPGKSPILVSGASSGERSVSAVAFLFALQEFSPASFYLFDEIDAHLDAAHVEKLGELLADEALRKNLQFIVISLKPEMVSKADKVYGVYNQNGISHVISMTFKEGKVA